MAATMNKRKLIIDFANDNRDVKELQFITDDPKSFEITDLSAHGMMNTILRVRGKEDSVIIKYGENTPRLGPNMEVSLDRQVTEFEALKLLETIHPGYAPRPFCHDKTHHIIAMEDMISWELLGCQLQAGIVDLNAATHLGQLLANMHLSTYRRRVTKEYWQQLVDKFSNDDQFKESITFLYKRTFDEADSSNSIPQEALQSFKQASAEIKELGLDQKAISLFGVREYFIHADCHWKSVFVKDGQCALLDFEFSFLGPAEQNVATAISSYLFCYNIEDETAEKDLEKKYTFREDSVQAVRNILNAYTEKHPDMIDDAYLLSTFHRHVGLFLGVSLVLQGVFYAMDEFQFHTDANRIFLFTRGFEVMKDHRKMDTVESFVNILFKL